MSKPLLVNIICPHCSLKDRVCVFASVNVTIHPELRDAIFDDSLNTHRCAQCALVGRVNVSVLYHDMEREFALAFDPMGERATLSKAELYLIGRLEKILGDSPKHLVNAPTLPIWTAFKLCILTYERMSRGSTSPGFGETFGEALLAVMHDLSKVGGVKMTEDGTCRAEADVLPLFSVVSIHEPKKNSKIAKFLRSIGMRR